MGARGELQVHCYRMLGSFADAEDAFATIFAAGRQTQLVPTRANGQPAFGCYLRTPDGQGPGTGLFAVTLSGDRISAMIRFESSVLPWFGLPLAIYER